jgi:hypothetical protein
MSRREKLARILEEIPTGDWYFPNKLDALIKVIEEQFADEIRDAQRYRQLCIIGRSVPMLNEGRPVTYEMERPLTYENG